MSFDPKTLRATELQISQVLKQNQENRNKYQRETIKLKDEIIDFHKVKGTISEMS